LPDLGQFFVCLLLIFVVLVQLLQGWQIFRVNFISLFNLLTHRLGEVNLAQPFLSKEALGVFGELNHRFLSLELNMEDIIDWVVLWNC